MFHEHTKHIQIDYHYIQKNVGEIVIQKGLIELLIALTNGLIHPSCYKLNPSGDALASILHLKGIAKRLPFFGDRLLYLSLSYYMQVFDDVLKTCSIYSIAPLMYKTRNPRIIWEKTIVFIFHRRRSCWPNHVNICVPSLFSLLSSFKISFGNLIKCNW